MRLPRIRLVWPHRWLPRRTPAPAPTPPPVPAQVPVLGDGVAEPGEVVWAWVPYEEDPSRGKDRPVLVIERTEHTVWVLPMTSVDHDRDAAQEAAEGRFWMDIGTGNWDVHHRPSEVRLDRIVEIDDAQVRREGAALDPVLFAQVIHAAAAYR